MPHKHHPAKPSPKVSLAHQPRLRAETPPLARFPDSPLLHADLTTLQRQIGNQAVQRLLRPAEPSGVPQTLRLQRARFLKNGDMLDPGDHLTPEDYTTDDIVAFANWLRYVSSKTLVEQVGDELESIDKPSRSEIVAKSVVKFLVTRNNRKSDSRNPLGKMLKDKWWKLFIDKKLHKGGDDLNNAMSFDVDSSPGYYMAMMNAFETHLEGIDPGDEIGQLTADDVFDMHDQVTEGTLKQEGDGFIPMPQDLSSQSTSYGVTKDEDAIPSLSGFQELLDSGVMGMHKEMASLESRGMINPNDPLSQFKYKAAKMTVGAQQEGMEFNSRLTPLGKFNATTNYQKKDVRGKINAFLKGYYKSMDVIAQEEYEDEAERQKDQLREIVRLIRALHVSHFFQDANGRLNTMVLLNKFLLENGFSPVIMDDTAVFGGELSVDQLVGQVVRGMNTFNAEIEEDPVDINVDRNYSFFHFFVDNEPDDTRVDILYVVELDLSHVPEGRAKAIQELLKTAKASGSCFQTGWRGQLIYKLGFTKPEPAERLERTLEAFT